MSSRNADLLDWGWHNMSQKTRHPTRVDNFAKNLSDFQHSFTAIVSTKLGLHIDATVSQKGGTCFPTPHRIYANASGIFRQRGRRLTCCSCLC